MKLGKRGPVMSSLLDKSTIVTAEMLTKFDKFVNAPVKLLPLKFLEHQFKQVMCVYDQ